MSMAIEMNMMFEKLCFKDLMKGEFMEGKMMKRLLSL
jgi:hypothetical protein